MTTKAMWQRAYRAVNSSKSWQKITFAMICGILVGIYFGKDAVLLKPLGDIFLNLIKMVTIPLIFFTLIYGITNIENSQDLKRIGSKAVVTFLGTGMFAVIIGIITSLLLKPGVGAVITLPKASVKDSLPNIGSHSITDLLVGIIPKNAISAMAEGHILQVILFAFFVGCCLNLMRDECSGVITLCRQTAQLSFKMIALIMKLAPLGVFGYMAYIVGDHGFDVIVTLSKLIFTIFLACFIQYLMFGVLIFVWARLSPLPFYRKMFETQLIAFSTSSSKATLVTLMNVAEKKLGITKQNSRFLIPLASALNMDGGAIYQGACAVFFAQMVGLDLTMAHYLTLLFMCTLASVGGAGIPGGVLLFLGMVLNSVGLPVEGVLLVASIDRILDMVTTLINVTGDACVALLIDRSEGTLDEKIYMSEQ